MQCRVDAVTANVLSVTAKYEGHFHLCVLQNGQAIIDKKNRREFSVGLSQVCRRHDTTFGREVVF